ncbi:hypothetical protein [Listeria monocytogenes]|uniref:hypothetical protein n=1 Tax=Listeria monocytogenes TaxID=1639 RepID=UPI001CB6BA08|nr:hypothetical protein [Listeria monocytogenes]
MKNVTGTKDDVGYDLVQLSNKSIYGESRLGMNQLINVTDMKELNLIKRTISV